MAESDSIPCHCTGSSFTDKVHAHSLTGDLRIIKSNKLRKLNCKGPKYRESMAVEFSSAMGNILEGIDICIRSWSQKKGLTEAILPPWENKLS